MARILIIEDEPDIVLSLEEDLRRQGHQTEAAQDGAAGLDLGKQGPWDLILLDVMLPKMDGFDVCSELRKAGVRAPIIMLTARAQEAEK
jgi:DNA-binding response OmpR family regulator